MVLYADDTSIIVADSSNSSFETNLNQTFKDINAWFNANLLTLNFGKTEYLAFRSMYFCNIVTHIMIRLLYLMYSKLNILVSLLMIWYLGNSV
jgi:hypothetical protein